MVAQKDLSDYDTSIWTPSVAEHSIRNTLIQGLIWELFLKLDFDFKRLLIC